MRGDSETSDNRLVLCQPCQPPQTGLPQSGAAPALRGLLRHSPVEKGLAKQLGCGARRGLSGTQGTWELRRCLWMLCRSVGIQTRDLWSCSAAKLLTSSARWSCATWCSCARRSSAEPEGPTLYHWSNLGWLCESACIMETGRFPPHSSLFFKKHKSQRHKLLSALSLFVYFHYEKWAGGMHSFHSGGRRAQPQDVRFRLFFPCCSGGLRSWPGCWGAARTVLLVQKQLLQSAGMPLQ